MAQLDSRLGYIDEFSERWNNGFRMYRVLFTVSAVLLIVGGIASFAYPLGVFSFIQALVSAALVVHGVSYIGSYVSSTPYFRQPLALVSGILSVVLGVLMLFMPVVFTATTLAIALAFLLIVGGVYRVSVASSLRTCGAHGAGVALVGGIATIVLGAAFLFLPLLGSLVMGYLVAGYLLASGVILLGEAVSMREIR